MTYASRTDHELHHPLPHMMYCWKGMLSSFHLAVVSYPYKSLCRNGVLKYVDRPILIFRKNLLRIGFFLLQAMGFHVRKGDVDTMVKQIDNGELIFHIIFPHSPPHSPPDTGASHSAVSVDDRMKKTCSNLTLVFSSSLPPLPPHRPTPCQ